MVIGTFFFLSVFSNSVNYIVLLLCMLGEKCVGLVEKIFITRL